MAHYLSQSLAQQMRMEQRLTPRLIQSMAILQKPVSDLEAYVEEALESNAALEMAEPESTAAEGSSGPAPAAHTLDDARFARMERFTREYGDWGEGSPRRPRSGDGEADPKMGAMANAPDHGETLQEHLLNQWSLVEIADEELRRAGAAIINRIEADGYLRAPLGELAAAARPPISTEAAEQALRLVHRLEPVGVGARDLKECLLLQLEIQPGDNRIERTLIEHHLDDIAGNRLPAIAKTTKYSLGEIAEAINVIRTVLHPHPGFLIGDRSSPPVRPDVIIDYADTGGGLDVRLARGNSPRLRIREDVAALAKSKDNGLPARDFARKHLEEAEALIDAIEFRRSRLLEISRIVAERQRDFFNEGPSGLRVLRMGDVAEEAKCDASTVSRTVADKFVQTPRGIYPLRYFFTGGTETEGGEAVGWDQIKVRVKQLIEAENSSEPLQDDEIAARLSAEGIDISRRTVAKYRKQLDIPNARQRKQF